MDYTLLIDAIKFVGLSITAGVVGNRSDAGFVSLLDWFETRGSTPTERWATEPNDVATSIATKMEAADWLVLERLLNQARLPEAATQNVYAMPGSKVVQIVRNDGPITFS